MVFQTNYHEQRWELFNNKKPYLRTLYSIVASDVKTATGANIRKILLDTNLDPRMAPKSSLGNWTVYEPSDSRTVPLLVSLLQMKNDKWVVNSYMEEEVETLQHDEIDFMIETVCTG